MIINRIWEPMNWASKVPTLFHNHLASVVLGGSLCSLLFWVGSIYQLIRFPKLPLIIVKKKIKNGRLSHQDLKTTQVYLGREEAGKSLGAIAWAHYFGRIVIVISSAIFLSFLAHQYRLRYGFYILNPGTFLPLVINNRQRSPWLWSSRYYA